MTDEPDEAASAEAAGEPGEPGGPAGSKRPKPTKAERLEAKAAKLREAEANRAAGDAAPVRARAGLVWSIVVLSVVCVGLATVLGILVPKWSSYRDTNSARAGALRAAEQYAIDFGSYDYQHLDADFAKVATHLTSDFKKSYLDSSSRLVPLIVQSKGRSVATVQGIGLTTASTSKAKVVVLLDQRITSSQTTTPRIDRIRLVMTLVHRDGKWLISKLVLK